ncbi:hypothetical protein [Caldisphaera sp.]
MNSIPSKYILQSISIFNDINQGINYPSKIYAAVIIKIETIK